jgi:hypothetical protein
MRKGLSLSRRDFLVGAAALARPLSLFALDSDAVVSRGKERDLLRLACSPEKLKQSLVPQGNFRPFPTIHDRGSWGALRAETRAGLLARGEKYLGYRWPELPATLFLEYARNGNRTDYESLRNARMAALQSLALCSRWHLLSASRVRAGFLTTSPTACGPLARRASGASRPTSHSRRPM